MTIRRGSSLPTPVTASQRTRDRLATASWSSCDNGGLPSVYAKRRPKRGMSGATREYDYLIENARLQGISEIVALSATRFLVLERDGNVLASSPTPLFERICEADIAGATKISVLGTLGATPILGRRTLEQATVAQLATAGIVTARKTLVVDLASVCYTQRQGRGARHCTGRNAVVSNDDYFGILSPTAGTLSQKLLSPIGIVDHVSLWQITLR